MCPKRGTPRDGEGESSLQLLDLLDLQTLTFFFTGRDSKGSALKALLYSTDAAPHAVPERFCRGHACGLLWQVYRAYPRRDRRVLNGGCVKSSLQSLEPELGARETRAPWGHRQARVGVGGHVG